MDQFFTDSTNQPETVNSHAPEQLNGELGLSSGMEINNFELSNANPIEMNCEPQPVYNTMDNENDFNDFEEDQVTRKIRQQQQRVQNMLREKSQTEWEDKRKRQEEGRRQFQEFINKKEQEKTDRAAQNIRKEAQLREDQTKLSEQAGWKKVISNINLKQGERKGPKDINRMRQAILHKREDDGR